MALCPCDKCYCTAYRSGRSFGSALCLSCEMGEHGTPREPNRFRICRVCGAESVAMDDWPEYCLNGDCGAGFGPVTLGMDRVSSKEAGKPMVTAAEWAKAVKATRRKR